MNIGIYIRLSNADAETGSIKKESDSIGNQRMYIHQFLNEHKVLKDFPRVEFVDDGFSATNGNRPQFTEMIEKVRRKEIQVICVKDFSRFFRDYIEAGNYLECVFPFLGVRFIAINDNYDSDDYKGSTGGLEMAIRNIIYASYSRDLSIKVKTAKRMMAEQGKYIGKIPPFGYKKDPVNKNKLLIDEEAAKIVRFIFEKALEGNKCKQIALYLNRENMMTRRQYYRMKNPTSGMFGGNGGQDTWRSEAVQNIIRNYMYTGALVSQRRTRIAVGQKKTKRQQPIIVKDVCQGIVTRDEYEKAQVIFRKQSRDSIKNEYYILKGLIHCGECKRKMGRHKVVRNENYYQCNSYKFNENLSCYRDKFTEPVIETIIFHAMEQYIMLLQNDYVNKFEEKLNGPKEKLINGREERNQLATVQLKLEQNRQAKIRSYEKYVNESIIKEIYQKQVAKIDEERIGLLHESEELEKISNHQNSKNKQGEQDMRNITNFCLTEENFTYELVHAMVKNIYIYSDGTLEIVWKFRNVFDL
ncbi:MAG: recombinase family protein [Eubacteriales bacterium]